jgi:hypothetical protein
VLAKKKPAFVHGSARQWAKEIGCSPGLVTELPLWQQTMRRSGRGRKGAAPAPKVQSLNEATTGEGVNEEVLEKLIAEQEADREPSPLDPEPKKVRQPKKL